MRHRNPNLTGFVFFLIVASLSASCASHPHKLGRGENYKPGGTWGYYSGPVDTRWNADGRTMTVLSELRYTDPQGVVWIAPAGSQIDGASMPRALWSFMGGPFEGKYRNASVLHDVAYDQKNHPPQEADRMFYNAMRCSGVGAIEAKTMFYSLYRFGRHGAFAIKKAKRVKPSELAQAEEAPEEKILGRVVNQTEINETRDWIKSAEPSMEQIEQRADAEPR
jgi:hypothetical protein